MFDNKPIFAYCRAMNMHGKKYPLFFIVLSLLLLIEPLSVHAYIDPGSGSLLVQMLIASVVGVSVGIRAFWGRIRLLFLRKKDISAPSDESKIIHDKT